MAALERTCRFCSLLYRVVGRQNTFVKSIASSNSFIRNYSPFNEDNHNIILPPSGPENDTITNQTGPKKLLRIGVLGEPNAGKSTFVNTIVGHDVCAVSPIPNTTYEAIYVPYTKENTQLVFIDTPGIVPFEQARRLKLGRLQITAPRRVIDESDILAVFVDMTSRRRRQRIHECILDLLSRHPDFPCVLVMNKIDSIARKVTLLKYASILTEDRKQDLWGYEKDGGYSGFKHVFMISGKTGDGVRDLKEYFLNLAKPGDWMYDGYELVDLPFEKRISEAFREVLLHMFAHEIPWQVKQLNLIVEMVNDDTIRIHQKLIWPKKSQARYVRSKIDDLKLNSYRKLRRTLKLNVILTLEVGSSASLARHLP